MLFQSLSMKARKEDQDSKEHVAQYAHRHEEPELEIHPTWARNPDEADGVIFRTPDWYRMRMRMKKPE